jgi:hypothetical protein
LPSRLYEDPEGSAWDQTLQERDRV